MFLIYLLILFSVFNIQDKQKLLISVLLILFINNNTYSNKSNSCMQISNKGFDETMKSEKQNLPQNNEIYNSNDLQQKYNNSCSMNSIEKYIKEKYKGTTITLLLSCHSGTVGEVIFDFDNIIAVKSDSDTYFINPNSIDIFF